MGYPTLSQGARLTSVRLKNADGKEIGRVVEWMMDVQEGKVIYVVAEIDSSSKYYAIPWRFMKADLEHGGYMIDQEEIENYDVSVDRDSMSDLVNDQEFLKKIFERYGLEQQTRQSRQPSGGTDTERQSPQKDDGSPSNAEMSEGKGYGG